MFPYTFLALTYTRVVRDPKYAGWALLHFWYTHFFFISVDSYGTRFIHLNFLVGVLGYSSRIESFLC